MSALLVSAVDRDHGHSVFVASAAVLVTAPQQRSSDCPLSIHWCMVTVTAHGVTICSGDGSAVGLQIRWRYSGKLISVNLLGVAVTDMDCRSPLSAVAAAAGALMKKKRRAVAASAHYYLARHLRSVHPLSKSVARCPHACLHSLLALSKISQDSEPGRPHGMRSDSPPQVPGRS